MKCEARPPAIQCVPKENRQEREADHLSLSSADRGELPPRPMGSNPIH
jgi:hypothetical protein